MRTYEYRTGIKNTLFGERVVALGFFDGVHIGHRELFRVAREQAKRYSLPFAVFTFSSDSKNIKHGSSRLYSDSEKLSLLSKCGADEVITADFDTLRDMSAESFVKDLLIGELGARCAVTGLDFRFGQGAQGTQAQLSELMRDACREAVAVDDVMLDGKKVSTTEIKRRLAEKDLAGANKMLGEPYFIITDVEHGRGVGRNLGYPTANCSLGGKESVIPRGVYRTVTESGGRSYPSLTNVGSCPTFDERKTHAETYILDFDGDVYDKTVRISFLEFLRDEIKFSSEKELKMQINIDINRAKGAF